MAIISMKNVNLRKQGKDLLQDINWTVEKGQTWAILGLNGWENDPFKIDYG